MEADVRYIIDNKLQAKGWVLDPNRNDRNVFFESPRSSAEKRKLGGKFPDYILYANEINNPITWVLQLQFGILFITTIGIGLVALFIYHLRTVDQTDEQQEERIKWSG